MWMILVRDNPTPEGGDWACTPGRPYAETCVVNGLAVLKTFESGNEALEYCVNRWGLNRARPCKIADIQGEPISGMEVDEY
jgi:hypothetical protein